MRQKDESISERSRTIYNCNNNAEKQFDIELGLLVYYLRNLPRLYQKKLSPIIGLLRTEYEKDNRVKEYANSVLCDV